MPITIPCACGKTLRVKDELAGKKVRCPACQKGILVPAPASPAPGPPEEKVQPAPPSAPAPAEEERPRRRPTREQEPEETPPQPKKKSALPFLLVGCLGVLLLGCLGSVGAVTALVIIKLRSLDERLVGVWVLDREGTRQLNLRFPDHLKAIRWEFRADGSCLLYAQDHVPGTWTKVSGEGDKIQIRIVEDKDGTTFLVNVTFVDADHIRVDPPGGQLRREGSAPTPSDKDKEKDKDKDKEKDKEKEKDKGKGKDKDKETPKEKDGPLQLVGHYSSITGLDFSPDSKLLASAAADTTCKVWEVSTGKPTATLKPFVGQPRSIVFLDASTVATASGKAFDEGHVRLWDTSGKEKSTLRQTNGSPHGLAYHAESGMLVFDDYVDLLVWDVKQNKEKARLKGVAGEIRDIAFSRDGKRVAVASAAGVNLFNASTGAPLPGPKTKEANAVAFTPSGDLAVGSESKLVRLYRPGDSKHYQLWPHPAAVKCLAISADGSLLAAGSGDSVIVRALPGGKVLTELKPRAGEFRPGRVAFSPDGKKLASGTADITAGTLYLWDLTTLPKSTP